ncbi:MAG: glucuronate isomerase, partial [Verrucomicrobiota bacterium]
MPFPDKDFLLQSPTALRLFHEVAADQPIYDYHTHLSPREIATNQRWTDLAGLWLGEDHYKWRLMRANGINEASITGNAGPREKFQAWAETVPYTLRNPIHHWTHIELQRYFDIDLLLGPDTADRIWEQANARIAEEDFCVHDILKKFKVKMIGTTDDPVDPLDDHLAIKELGIDTRVCPTFRPDKAFGVDQPGEFNPWIDRLEAITDTDISQLDDLLNALQRRHDDFHSAGCRLSDHSFDHCPALPCDDADAAIIFEQARSGGSATAEEREKFSFYLMMFLGRLDAARGWTKQLHLGPMRNLNPSAFRN